MAAEPRIETVSAPEESRPYPFGPADGLDLHPTYRQLRDRPGLVKIQPPFGRWTYLATRYDEVRSVLTDPRLSRAGVVGEDEPRVHPFVTDKDALSALDPPDHTRLRRVMMGAFTARRMAALRPRVQQIIDQALDELAQHGSPADFVALVAVPVPTTVIAELLGVPPTDRAQFMVWSDVVLTAEAGRSPEEVFGAYQQITGYLAARLAERREQPGDDFLSALVAAHEEQDRLSDGEMVNLATTVLIAGHETTVSQLASFTYLLLSQPERAAQLRSDPDLVPAAVEELLRVAPVMAAAGFARVATEDIELAGVTIKAGETVMPVHYSANRDERVFPDPDTVDFGRENAAAHVAFSHGPHHCPGAGLARIELQLALATLLRRFPDLRLAVPPEQVPWKKSALARGPQSLPVAWG